MRTLVRLTLAVALIAGGGCDSGGDTGSARVALAGVGGLTSTELLGDTTVTLRRVWEGFPVGWGSAPSPEGRYVMTTEGPGVGDLVRIDLVDGTVLPVKEEGTWSESQAWEESSVFSPDGKRVVYVRGFTGNYEIRVANVDGSEDRVLVPAPRGPFYAIVHEWRGNEIIAEVWTEDPAVFAIVAISQTDGAMRTIKSFGDSWGRAYSESPLPVDPSGTFLAYSERSPGGTLDAVVIRTSDGSETGRILGPANDQAVAWTPDGRFLLLHSDRGMTEGVWRVAMDAGRPVGEADLIRGDLWNFEPIGSSADAYFFGVRTDDWRVRTAAFDPDAGMLLSEPAAVEGMRVGQSGTPIWSPDGNTLAYTREGPKTYDGLGQNVLVLRAASGPEERTIPLPRMSVRKMFSWSSDGHIVMIGKGGGDGDWHVWSVDLETGRVETLLDESDEGPVVLPRASADGRTFYSFSQDHQSIVAEDLTSRRVETLAGPVANVELGYLSLSPDGRTLAVAFGDRSDGSSVLATLPASGGTLREVFRQAPPDGIRSGWVLWAPDGKRLFFATHGVPAKKEPPRIWQADLSGHDPVVSEARGLEGLVSAHATADLALSPDGRRIAFQGGEPKGEIWMMTNLDGSRR